MKRFAIGLLLLAPATSFADKDWTLDVRGFAGATAVKLSDDDFRFKPKGVDTGVRAMVIHRDGLFALAEYTYADVDRKLAGIKVDLELDEFRFGGGYLATISPQFRLGGFAAYVDEEVKIGDDFGRLSLQADGFNVGALAEFDVTPTIHTYGRAGYLNLDPEDGGSNGDGVDLHVGVDYRLAKGLAVFVEYRYTHLQSSGAELDYNSYRGGIRLTY